MCKEKSSKFEVFSNGFVKITKENADIAKSQIDNDPFYKKAFDKNNNGTSAYMFEHQEYNEKLIKRVNTENSTRLSKNDIEIVAGNIKKVNINLNNENLDLDYNVLTEVYDNCSRTLLSFASKYCHFYLLHRKGEKAADKFPIIDSIMRKVIPIYDYLYNSDKDEYSKYKTESNLYKYRTAEYKDIQPSVIEYYKDYFNALYGIK